MKDQRVAGFLMVLVLVLSLIGVSGLSGAQAQTAAVSPSQAPAVKAPAPVTAPAFPNAAPGDAVMSVAGSLLKPTSSNVAFAVDMEGGSTARATSLCYSTPPCIYRRAPWSNPCACISVTSTRFIIVAVISMLPTSLG